MSATATRPRATAAPATSASTAAAQDAGQYLGFLLGGRTFAIGIEAVAEIIKLGPVTKVPRTPPHIRGVINLRGAVLPLLDGGVYVGQPPAVVSGQSCVVVIHAEPERNAPPLGLLVDSVSAVLRIASSEIEPVPPFGVGLPPQLLVGMVRSQDRFVAVIDVARAFSIAALAERGWHGTAVGSSRR